MQRGGWLADRRSPTVVLAVLLLSSGVWDPLISVARPACHFHGLAMDSRSAMGPCLAASVMLGVPAFGLSGVLPALLRLAIADMGHLGRHTGGMIAVSTIGSLVGTWGTSFYLLTWLGSTTLVAMLGLVLVDSVCCGPGVPWVFDRVFITDIAGLALLGWTSFHPILILPQAVHEEDSPYQQVRVRDNDLFRFLILNNTFHAVMWKVAPTYLALPYSQVMMAALPYRIIPNEG